MTDDSTVDLIDNSTVDLIDDSTVDLIDNSTVDRLTAEVYLLIKSEHPCWTLIILATISTTLAIVGILLNFSVIYITIRTKSLRGSVNILLAAYSLCEIVSLSSYFVFTFTTFSGQYFIAFKTAFCLMMAPTYAAGLSFILMLLTGFERLFTVLFPLRDFNFMFIYVLPICCFWSVGGCSYFLYYFDENQSTNEVLGHPSEMARIIYNGKERYFVLLPGVATLLLIVIIYALIAIIIFFRKAPPNSNSAQINARIFRSLFAIVSVNFGGYIVTLLFLFLFYSFMDNPMLLWSSTQIVGLFAQISAASNAPILYFTSSAYRKAFREQFAFLCRNSAVTPIFN